MFGHKFNAVFDTDGVDSTLEVVFSIIVILVVSVVEFMADGGASVAFVFTVVALPVVLL